MPGASPLVVLDQVVKTFGPFTALDHVDLSIDRGEVVVVIGPSGSGKSTLCRCINRLETIDSGTITLDGQPLSEEGRALAALRSDVGMVFQSFNPVRPQDGARQGHPRSDQGAWADPGRRGAARARTARTGR